MQRHWSEQELETYWSFSSDELALIPQQDASSQLGVAASLKFCQLEGFFPASVKDIPSVRQGLGVSIVSTSKGVMSDANARSQNVGGEVLCTVF